MWVLFSPDVLKHVCNKLILLQLFINPCPHLIAMVQTRGHMDFICRMKEYLPRSEFIERTIKAIEAQFSVKSISLEAIDVPSASEFVHTTRLLTEQEIQEACTIQT